MAETIISPGVLAIENDQSFVTQQPIQAGAAIIGPTVKGKVGIPTIVTSYSDYLNKFGSTFLSGSQTYTYFTSIAAYSYFNNGGISLLVTRVVTGSFTPATSSFISASAHSAGAPYNTNPFVLETISKGEIMNSTGPTGNYNTLLSGSADNFRWQITNANTSSGTFTLLVRQGNDTSISPSIVETWGPLSLDPYSPNYIEKIIGNQVENVAVDNGEYYIQLSGSYTNNSSYIRVKQVNQLTPNYFDNVGVAKPEYTGSIPINSSGSFGNATGKLFYGGDNKYYEQIISGDNIQGIPANAYTESILLLANKDAFNYNLLVAPGLMSDIAGGAPGAITSMITTAQNRGDMMVVFDSSKYNSQINSVLSNTAGYDTSYAATYWPWVKTIDPNTAAIFESLSSIAKAVKETGLKISAHPSEYISLTSPKEEVIANSTRDLASHAELFDLIGLPQSYEAPLNIHCRQDGDPEAISSSFLKNFDKLPDNVKNRLVLEVNDNKEGIWSIVNLHKFYYQRANIPVTFDNL